MIRRYSWAVVGVYAFILALDNIRAGLFYNFLSAGFDYNFFGEGWVELALSIYVILFLAYELLHYIGSWKNEGVQDKDAQRYREVYEYHE